GCAGGYSLDVQAPVAVVLVAGFAVSASLAVWVIVSAIHRSGFGGAVRGAWVGVLEELPQERPRHRGLLDICRRIPGDRRLGVIDRGRRSWRRCARRAPLDRVPLDALLASAGQGSGRRVARRSGLRTTPRREGGCGSSTTRESPCTCRSRR